MLREGKRSGFTLIEVLVVVGLIGILMSLLLPAVQSTRETARRTQCASQMGQLALGVLAYEATHELLPPGSVNSVGPIVSGPPGYHHSWFVQVLPYLDQSVLYSHLNFDAGVYDAANTTATSRQLGQLMCPSSAGPPFGSPNLLCSYAGNHHHDEAPIDVTNTGVLFLNSRLSLDDLLDGRSQTILLGERRPSTVELGWASGSRSTLRNGGHLLSGPDPKPTPAVPDPVGGFGTYHPGGSQFAYADGRVSFLKNTASRIGILQPLLNRADGQIVDQPVW